MSFKIGQNVCKIFIKNFYSNQQRDNDGGGDGNVTIDTKRSWIFVYVVCSVLYFVYALMNHDFYSHFNLI